MSSQSLPSLFNTHLKIYRSEYVSKNESGLYSCGFYLTLKQSVSQSVRFRVVKASDRSPNSVPGVNTGAPLFTYPFQNSTEHTQHLTSGYKVTDAAEEVSSIWRLFYECMEPHLHSLSSFCGKG